MPDDLLQYYKEWDSKLELAFQHFDSVQQPLEPIISPEVRYKVYGIASKTELMDSILNCFYNDDEKLMQVKEGLLHSHAW